MRDSSAEEVEKRVTRNRHRIIESDEEESFYKSKPGAPSKSDPILKAHQSTPKTIEKSCDPDADLLFSSEKSEKP